MQCVKMFSSGVGWKSASFGRPGQDPGGLGTAFPRDRPQGFVPQAKRKLARHHYGQVSPVLAVSVFLIFPVTPFESRIWGHRASKSTCFDLAWPSWVSAALSVSSVSVSVSCARVQGVGVRVQRARARVQCVRAPIMFVMISAYRLEG